MNECVPKYLNIERAPMNSVNRQWLSGWVSYRVLEQIELLKLDKFEMYRYQTVYMMQSNLAMSLEPRELSNIYWKCYRQFDIFFTSKYFMNFGSPLIALIDDCIWKLYSGTRSFEFCGHLGRNGIGQWGQRSRSGGSSVE